jgi:DNA transposition AAA+ family ATPase
MIETDPIISTNNYETVLSVCKETHIRKEMNAIVGETGYGKTIPLKIYLSNYENVYYMTAKASMNAKEFYSTLYNAIGNEGYNPSYSINFLIMKTANKFNENSHNKLLIIDEAGKFHRRMLEYLHEFRDLTSETTGIILSGPGYFKSSIEDWKDKGIKGIPEVYSRINSWITLQAPLKKEKIQLIREFGINDERFEQNCDKIPNFRELVSAIKRYLSKQDEIQQHQAVLAKKKKKTLTA